MLSECGSVRVEYRMTGDKEVQILRMTLDELINAMEPQARKDKALFHDVEQLSERGHRNSIGDASDVGAALSKLQAHPMLRNTLLFPQLCDAVPHKRFIAAVVVHDPLPPISAYYFNIRERCGFALKSSTFASHNE